MFALSLSRRLQRHGIHYAWVIMAIVFLTMLVSSAALGLPGAFMTPLSKEFGWSTAQIAAALAVRFALYGLIGPFAAVLMERYGLRRIVCTALVLICVGLLLVTRMNALWQLVVLWGFILGIGSGLTALVLAATVANQWFDKRRGLVLGLLTASSATGQLLFLPIASALILHEGWRVAVMPVASCCLVVAVLGLLLLESRPRALGLGAYGAAFQPAADLPGADLAGADSPRAVSGVIGAARTSSSKTRFSEPLTRLRQVSGNTTFWVLFGTFLVCGLSTNGLIQTHFISLCGDYGLAALPAASVLAMIGGFDFVGTIASGWLSDRFDNRWLLFWYYGLRGLSLLWLPHSSFSFYGLSLFAMFYGLDWVATVPPTVKLAGAAFGKERGAMIFGWIFAGHQIGSATAAYGAGLSRTLLLSYSPALYAAGLSCIVAAAAIFLIGRPRSPTSVLIDAPALGS